ncbi:TRAP transporter substrate-binding protein [Salsuginibacillus kocurii]|uniref:TRAP transporter substrate-binding protein n=1 Tax=Salsuginibacillus kocurii TaxID=427078 RepID=UPI000365158D|nr:TRAP transporter substrate-binding protein [Salsuginibacillus kocurii]
MRKWSTFLSIVSLSFIIVGCGESDETAGPEESENGDDNGSEEVEETTADDNDAAAGEGEDGEYTITFAHVVNPSTAKGEAAEYFGELMEERSDGRVEVDIHPDSQLGSDREITEQMQSGTIQMNAPFTGVLPQFVPQFQVFDLPYLFDDKDSAYDSMHGEMGEALNEYLSNEGLRALGYWDGGFKHFTNSERAIEEPEDMDGLRMRASQSPLLSAQFDALNAGGVSIDFAELYTALQQGTVDGQENPLSNIVTQNFYEVQDYMTYSEHGYMGYVLLISEEFYQELPDDLQQMVEEVAEETGEWQWEQAQAAEEEYEQVLEEEDVETHELTEDQREQFIEATEGVYDIFLEDVEDAEEILDLVE